MVEGLFGCSVALAEAVHPLVLYLGDLSAYYVVLESVFVADHRVEELYVVADDAGAFAHFTVP